MGETSDNLPGVPGVGPGFAARWINQYDGLDNVITHADEITGKKGEALREHLGDVIRNRQLNALVRDLDLELAPADLAAQSWDRQEVHTLFDGLEFRVLRDRLLRDAGRPEEAIDDSGFELAGVRSARARWPTGWPAHTERRAARACTVEGRWGSGTGEVWSLAFATADGTGAWVDAGEVSPEDDAALVTWFADASRTKVLHDAKGPMLALAARGLAAARGWSATPRCRPTSPGPTSAPTTWPTSPCATSSASSSRAPPTTGSSASTGSTTPASDASETAMLHARAVLDLAAALDDELEERGGTRLLADVELPLVDLLARMEQTGIAVDVDHLEALEADFAAGCVKLAAEAAYAVIGKEINLGSPKQLQVVLFDELGMPKTKRTKTGYTTDADALQALTKGPSTRS